MPKAILALRSYPLAILMALVLFVCSFLIATSSIGTIDGGDDQGSGMGGTGRTGGYTGDSGFGGTGSPGPAVGSSDAVRTDIDGASEADANDSLIEAFLQQQRETARLPDDMRPLIELQRALPSIPDFDDSTPAALDILDEDSQPLPPHARRLLEMAESRNSTIVEPALEIQIQIPEATGTDDIERYRMEVAEQIEPETPEPDANSEPGAQAEARTDKPRVLERLITEEIADIAADDEVDEQVLELDANGSDRPLIPERIQRPELPPFQRMRPTVDRASITPPRPRPMQI